MPLPCGLYWPLPPSPRLCTPCLEGAGCPSGFGQELVGDWQPAASSVLVAVGKHFINPVMEEVLSKLQPGLLPHPLVLQTLAGLSVSNGMLPSGPGARPVCWARGQGPADALLTTLPSQCLAQCPSCRPS